MTERRKFLEVLKSVHDFYGKDITPFNVEVWEMACRTFSTEQVSKALSAHLMDPERGQFMPKPADIVRQLQGTHGDRAVLAWGKLLEAAQRVGAYTTVCFDDGIIHAVVEDMGGWVKFCRSSVDDLGYAQKRFCDAYKAYSSRPDVRFPFRLLGEHDQNNSAKGYRMQEPTLIGDPHQARLVYEAGHDTPRVQITTAKQAVPLLERA